MRSEVTGDAETTFEASAGALPSSRNERAVAKDRPDIAARRILVRMLIHQLEVEVEVGDRVPADVRANELSVCMGREDAGANAPDAERADSPLILLQMTSPIEPSRSV